MNLPVPRHYHLSRAVCSYGYYMLAPSRWDKATRTLHRPLWLGRTLVQTTTTQPRAGAALAVTVDRKLTKAQRDDVARQLRRVLRLDEDFTAFWKVFPDARARRFGPLYRSPSLFEDIVKTMTGCNVTWSSTIRMNALLCEHVGDGGFPRPDQLAAVPASRLKTLCKVGYRAERIVRLARDVDRGRLDLSRFEQPGLDTQTLLAELRQIHGIGPYAAANIAQLLGHYDVLAIDSETYRHYCQRQGIERPRNPQSLHAAIEALYEPYRPYRFLAYWCELWHRYPTEFRD
jgi:3-methyladenine DNA glycosylase/8-oxoguanine DNA glycosylase